MGSNFLPNPRPGKPFFLASGGPGNPAGVPPAPRVSNQTALGQAPAAPSGVPTPTAEQLVRQPELAEAYQQHLNNITNVGQSAVDEAVGLAPQLRDIAATAYQSSLAANDLSSYQAAVDSAAVAQQSTLQKTVSNLQAQAKQGYNTSLRNLNSRMAAYGLTGNSTELQRNLGDAYYRNFLPVEAQVLSAQAQGVRDNFNREAAMQSARFSANSLQSAAASQYASALGQPIGLQLSALGQMGAALAQTAPVADRAYFNFVQGDDNLPEIPYASPSYNLPQLQDNSGALLDAIRAGNSTFSTNRTASQNLAAAPATTGHVPWDTRSADDYYSSLHPRGGAEMMVDGDLQSGIGAASAWLAQRNMLPDNLDEMGLSPEAYLARLREGRWGLAGEPPMSTMRSGWTPEAQQENPGEYYEYLTHSREAQVARVRAQMIEREAVEAAGESGGESVD